MFQMQHGGSVGVGNRRPLKWNSVTGKAMAPNTTTSRIMAIRDGRLFFISTSPGYNHFGRPKGAENPGSINGDAVPLPP